MLPPIFTDISHENLALGKPTKLSSTYFKAGYGSASSNLAVDGNKQSYMVQPGRFVCAHTGYQASGDFWWMVDLEEIYPVSKITILNRKDCCSQLLRKLIITVGETENDSQICSEYEGPGGPGETVVIKCETPLLGRFVRISKSVRELIAMCEVEIYR
ncbi:fucolectin-7-like [Mercenaria mercenaria]|uniref:fucolectin-7-like n=1 Tax=Mercenaria mercenaria TaxID=6596 RepID=UPI00234EA655|nr:fucolectin-7-like [Mercenaria mercenaria]